MLRAVTYAQSINDLLATMETAHFCEIPKTLVYGPKDSTQGKGSGEGCSTHS